MTRIGEPDLAASLILAEMQTKFVVLKTLRHISSSCHFYSTINTGAERSSPATLAVEITCLSVHGFALGSHVRAFDFHECGEFVLLSNTPVALSVFAAHSESCPARCFRRVE